MVDRDLVGVRALIAEDDAIIRMHLSALLGGVVQEVLTAQDGFAALQTARNHRCSLVLLDINMPGMDGEQTVRKLRQMDAYRAVPIFAVTAYDSQEDITRFHQAGFTDIIRKPFDALAIMRRVRKALDESEDAAQ